MFKRILVAVDASETSDVALRAAAALAAAQHAELRIVHVIDTANVNMGADFPAHPAVLESLAKSGETVLQKAQAIAKAAGATVETKLVTIEALGQRVAEAIANEADAWPADLIVVGTHGRRGLTRLFLGSVAEGTARLASKPVLLIPGK